MSPLVAGESLAESVLPRKGVISSVIVAAGTRAEMGRIAGKMIGDMETLCADAADVGRRTRASLPRAASATMSNPRVAAAI